MRAGRVIYVCHRFKEGGVIYCGVEHRGLYAASRCLRGRDNDHEDWLFVTEMPGFYKRLADRAGAGLLRVEPER